MRQLLSIRRDKFEPWTSAVVDFIPGMQEMHTKNLTMANRIGELLEWTEQQLQARHTDAIDILPRTGSLLDALLATAVSFQPVRTK